MKSVSVSVYKMILGIVLYALVFCFGGCTQPGETASQGDIRHQRNLSINQEGMMKDIDRVLLFDQPSKLSDTRIP